MLIVIPKAWPRVAAGGTIVNTAQAAFDREGVQGSTSSNSAVTRIAEVLDLTLAPKLKGPLAVPPSGSATFGIPFILTNTGNGNEAFHVAAALPDGSALAVAIDVNENGIYDPSIDVALSPAGTTPMLAPGQGLTLLVHFADQIANDGTVTITAKALTGSGSPGTTFTGTGDDGTDAIVGLTHAEASAELGYTRASGTQPPATLEKSQSVRAPDGSTTPQAGAVITYRLALSVPGTTQLNAAEIVDAIPAGTAFVPGSIRIEDVAASDVADADAAFFDGKAIHIALGDISQPTTRVVTFQVTIL